MGNNKKIVAVISFVAVASFAAGAVWGQGAGKKEPVITLAADVKWQPLDTNAGVAGPQAAVVFGDMKKKAPIGLSVQAPGRGRGGGGSAHALVPLLRGVDRRFVPQLGRGAAGRPRDHQRRVLDAAGQGRAQQ